MSFPFHHRRVGIEEEAPVRVVASEQRVRSARPCDRGTHDVSQPAVADFLSEHAQRVVLAEELRAADRRGTSPSQSITTIDRRRPPLPVSGRDIEDVLADAADLVRDGQLVGERVADERLIGPRAGSDRSCRGASRRTSSRPRRCRCEFACAKRSTIAPPPGPASRSMRSTSAIVGRRPGRDADDGVGDVDGVGEFHLDAAVREQRRLRRHACASSRSRGRCSRSRVNLIGRGVDEDLAGARRRIEVGEERRDARAGR